MSATQKTPTILQERLARDFLGWRQAPVSPGTVSGWRNRDGVAVALPLPTSSAWAEILKQELRRLEIPHLVHWSSIPAPEKHYMARVALGDEWAWQYCGETEAAALMLAVAGLPPQKGE